MSKELDRRIAETIFGEPEPPPPTLDMDTGEDSPGGVWSVAKAMPGFRAGVWQPESFSTNLDLAMRAVDKYRADVKGVYPDYEGALYMEYLPGHDPAFEADMGNGYGEGQTLPEAICRLLLALVEMEKP